MRVISLSIVKPSKSETLFLFFNVFLPILGGGVVYIAFRDTNILMFKWFDAIGILNYLFFFRKHLSFITYNIPECFIYSIPDALWLYSFCVFLYLVWSDSHILRIIVPSVVIILTIIAEILPLFDILSGTFDFIDLWMESTSGAISLLICNIHFKKRKYLD